MNFCTIFDSEYLLKGLVMYRSLEENCDDFHLYIFLFDEKSEKILKELNLSKATIISQTNFEDKQLLSVKNFRSKSEYFWTSTPFVIDYAINKFNLDSCTYLDADLLFFDSPAKLLDELGNDSIMITEHRYHPEHDKTETAGKYCVQFNTFVNDQRGKQALDWWKDACLQWCYARSEDGKFGDQKYLDDWPKRFKGVHELQHIGGGVAPWNIARYEIFEKDGNVFIEENKRVYPLIFYHFHKTNIYNIRGDIKTKTYFAVNKNPAAQKFIYKKYEAALSLVLKEVRETDPLFKTGLDSNLNYFKEELRELTPSFLKKFLKSYRYLLRNSPKHPTT